MDKAIFLGRTAAGEVLYDVLGWPRAPRVYAISLGGLEVGCSVAYLGRGVLGTVLGPPGPSEQRATGPVLLVDDGCTPPDELLAGVDHLLAAEGDGLVLASPWLAHRVREGARAREVRTVALLTGRHLPRPLYPEGDPPSAERVTRFLETPAAIPSRLDASDPLARLAGAP